MPTKTVERAEFDMAKRAALAKYAAAIKRADDAYRGDMAEATRAYKQATAEQRADHRRKVASE